MTRLYLTDLTLSHFRSHKAAHVELDGRPVALFGPNGAGKTNILEAISLLSPGRGLRRAAADDISRKPEAVGWRIGANLISLHQSHDLDTRAQAGSPRTVTIDGKSAPQVALGRIARMLWLVPAMDRLWTEGAEGRRRFLDRMVLSFEPAHADAVLAYEKAMRERNRLLKDQVQDDYWYGALETQMAEAGAAIMRNRATAIQRVLEAQENAETAFPKASLAIVGPETERPETQSDLKTAFADGRRRDIAAGRTLTGPHRADLAAVFAAKGVTAAQCSTGEQKALLISIVLANARALAQDFGAPPILLLDEVAAHLDAGRRAALYDEIVALGAQAILTGTGPELFAELETRAQHFEVTETDGESHIQQEGQ